MSTSLDLRIRKPRDRPLSSSILRICSHKSSTETPRAIFRLCELSLDADILVAALPRRRRYRLDRIAAVARDRVGVEIASKVSALDQLREFSRLGLPDFVAPLSQFGLDKGQPERAIERPLRGKTNQPSVAEGAR